LNNLHGVEQMKDVQVLDELHVLTVCQKVVCDLLSLTQDDYVSASQLSVLLQYLQSQQEKIVEKLS
jgi:hypothetical protein